MDELIDVALSDPWNRILFALAPLVLPLPFIAILNQILKSLGFQTTIFGMAQGAIRPLLRDREQARPAAVWAIVASYGLFVAAAPSVDVFFPERGIPWSGFVIGLAASTAAAIALFRLVPMLNIARVPQRSHRYASSSVLMAAVVPLLVLGLFIDPPERIEVLLAISGDETMVEKLEREIGNFEDKAGGRVHARFLDQSVTSFQKAQEALATERGELIIFGSIERDEGAPEVVLSLNIADKWEAIETDVDPYDFPVLECAATAETDEAIDAERNAAIEASSVAAFGLAFVDIKRAGPEQALETLALAGDISGRVCQDTAATTHGLADQAYSSLLLVHRQPELQQDLRAAFEARLSHPDSSIRTLTEGDPFFWRWWGELQLRQAGPVVALPALEKACSLVPNYESAIDLAKEVARLAGEEEPDCGIGEDA